MARTPLRLEDVSTRTGIPVETLRYWRKIGEGGPPTFKLGRRVVVDEDDLDTWLNEQRQSARVPRGAA